jgi:hypothetical protein
LGQIKQGLAEGDPKKISLGDLITDPSQNTQSKELIEENALEPYIVI